MATWTTDDLARIERAIADGVTSVQYTDRKVDYRSLDEMMQIRNLILKSLGFSNENRRVYASSSKGLNGGGYGS